MKNIKNNKPSKYCNYDNCMIIASYNYPECTKKIYCKKHKKEDMININPCSDKLKIFDNDGFDYNFSKKFILLSITLSFWLFSTVKVGLLFLKPILSYPPDEGTSSCPCAY